MNSLLCFFINLGGTNPNYAHILLLPNNGNYHQPLNIMTPKEKYLKLIKERRVLLKEMNAAIKSKDEIEKMIKKMEKKLEKLSRQIEKRKKIA